MTAVQIPPNPLGPTADWEPWIGNIRVSTWREEAISPEIQEASLRAWAARTRRRLLEPLTVDLDESGRHFKRKIMGDIERVERREARGIAVWKYSRFGRTDLGVRINLARLERAGGQLVSATEDIDVTTAVGKFNRAVLFDLAVLESDRAGEQWQETHALRIANGVPATGRKRFGYLWTPRRVPDATSPTGWRTQPEGYRLHPDYAPICDELYERKTEDHDGFESLARWLTDDLLIPAQRGTGGPWPTGTVKNMLDSGFAAGLLRIHDPGCRCPYRTTPRRERRPSTCTEGRMLYVPGAHPAIISADRWQRYLEHRAEVKATTPRARRATYPLTGLVTHGACRAGVSAGSATLGGQQVRGHALVCTLHKNSRRACPAGLYVSRADIEGEVRAWLAAGTAPLPGLVAATALAPAAPRPDVAAISAELAGVEAALTRATASHARGLYSDDEYVAARDGLRANRDALTGRLAAATKATAAPTRESLRPLMGRLLQTWRALAPTEINSMLRLFVHRIVVHDVRVEGEREYGFRIEVHPRWEPDPWTKPQAVPPLL